MVWCDIQGLEGANWLASGTEAGRSDTCCEALGACDACSDACGVSGCVE